MPASVSLRRFWFLNLVIGIVFCVLTYQFVQLTVLRQPALKAVAQRQHTLTIDLPPFRGAILDARGKELATNLKVPSVYAVPRLLTEENRKTVAREVSNLLGVDYDFALERLSRDKSFVWIRRRVTHEEAKKIRELKLPSLGIIEDYQRFYPQGDLLAQVLGFTNIDNEGLEGLELKYDHALHGRPGKRYTKRDALGREIKAFEIKTIPAVHGHKVVLTIDQYLQYLTETALEKAYREWNAKGAMAVLMDPASGRILAIANRPGFDLNHIASANADSRRNRAITDTYEPGSVFKIVTASAALNEGVANTETNFFCENGEYRYGSRTLHDVHPYGDLSFADVIVKSSNIGAVKIAALMKPDVFQSYIDGYGFGKKTQIDLPGEVSGFTRPPAQWSKTTPYNIPMGHEIMVTAIQMTAAMATLANGGDRVKPYIVSHIEDQSGFVMRRNLPQVVKHVVRPEVAKQMREMLTRVVEEGTGKRARIEGTQVGGKTGTAQKVLPGGKGYSHDSFISSFVGFAPSENPQLAMAVVLDDPHPSYYGGTVAAPVFKEVMERGLLYLGYIPEEARRLEPSNRKPVPQANPPMFVPAQAAGTRI